MTNLLLNNKSLIRTKPVKIPERVVMIHKRNGFTNYTMYNLKGDVLGTMKTIPERVDTPDFYPAKEGYLSLYIKDLKSNLRNSGVGKSLINFAKRNSYKECCDGRVHLIAQNPKNINDKPDIFYRKCGFDSQNKYHIEKIDEAIKNKTPILEKWFQTLMFLPLNKK